MDRFIRDVFIFSIIFVLTNILTYNFITKGLLYDKYEFEISNIKQSNFIFSDSHGWALTNNFPKGKKMLSDMNFQNLSYGSDSYFDIYFKLEYLIKNNVKIDTIFVSVDDHMLSPYRNGTNNRNRSIVYSDYESYNHFFPLSKPEYFLRKYLIRFLPLTQTSNSKLLREYFKRNFDIQKEKIPEDDQWGQLSNEERVLYSKRRKEILFPEKMTSLKLKNCLLQIIELSSANNINVIGLKFPIAQSFQSVIDGNNFGADRVLKSKGLNIINLESAIVNEKLFKNQDHLNNEGVIYFLNLLSKSKK